MDEEVIFGEGAFGKLSKEKLLGEDVIVKHIPEKVNENEYKVLKLLNDSPAKIAPRYITHEFKGSQLYITVEYLKCKELFEYLKHQPTLIDDLFKKLHAKQDVSDIKSALLSKRELAVKVNNLMEELHKLKIIHGDIKPENIILTDGGPLLIDFGSSLFESDCSLFQDTGSLEYRANVALFHPLASYDFEFYRSLDKYSMGVTIFCILTNIRFITEFYWLLAAVDRNSSKTEFYMSKALITLPPAYVRLYFETFTFYEVVIPEMMDMMRSYLKVNYFL